MTYAAGEARQELLDAIGEAVDGLAAALAALGAAHEQVSEAEGDRLEQELFRPVQVAYGRAKRTYTGFATRHGLAVRDFEPGDPAGPSAGSRRLVEEAVESIADSDALLTELQDSMRPVEVGDPELRAGLAEVRGLLGTLGARARAFLRTLGR